MTVSSEISSKFWLNGNPTGIIERRGIIWNNRAMNGTTRDFLVGIVRLYLIIILKKRLPSQDPVPLFQKTVLTCVLPRQTLIANKKPPEFDLVPS